MQHRHLFSILLLLASAALSTSCQEQNSSKSDESVAKTNSEEMVSGKSIHTMKKNYSFRLATDSLREVLEIDTLNLAACRTAAKSYSYEGGTPPVNWQKDYFDMFVGHPSIEKEAKALTQSLKHHAQENQDHWAEAVVAFVQGAISYDWNTYHRINESKIRYPLETLADGTGVCADKSLLLARLLTELDYDLVLFVFEKANHMGVGIRVPAGYGDFGTPYAFVESTNYTPIGRIPEKYVGNIRLEKSPKVYAVIGSGNKSFQKIVGNQAEEQALEKKYGKEFLFLKPEQQDLQIQMHEIQSEMEGLDIKIQENGCAGTVSSTIYEMCKGLVDKKNELVNQYNDLVNEFNALNQQAV